MTVIFDLDGTLLDTIADLTTAGNAVCRENGWPEHSAEEFKKMVGHGLANLVSRLSIPEARDPEQIAKNLRRFGEYYSAHCLDETRPYLGIPEMLKALKKDGIQMAVYSNKADDFSQTLIQHFFPDIFTLVQGKRAGVPVKPDPTGLYSILKALKVTDNSAALFVGDSPTDIRTGHNAGLLVCGVTWGFRSRDSLSDADWLTDSPEDLEHIIRQQASKQIA